MLNFSIEEVDFMLEYLMVGYDLVGKDELYLHNDIIAKLLKVEKQENIKVDLSVDAIEYFIYYLKCRSHSMFQDEFAVYDSLVTKLRYKLGGDLIGYY